MPVTTRRTGLNVALSPASVERSTQPTGRIIAKHRRTKPANAPRAAAAMTLSVGLAVSGGAALSTDTAQAATASANTTRGNTSIYKKPALRFGDSGSAVRWIQVKLHVPQKTGWYGSATMKAVARFQRSVGVRGTGNMDQRTWTSMIWFSKHPRKVKSSSFHARVLREAAKLRGTPYRYGGTTPRGFDCSGYTGYVYKRAGDRKSTRLNSSHGYQSRMPSSA